MKIIIFILYLVWGIITYEQIPAPLRNTVHWIVVLGGWMFVWLVEWIDPKTKKEKLLPMFFLTLFVSFFFGIITAHINIEAVWLKQLITIFTSYLMPYVVIDIREKGIESLRSALTNVFDFWIKKSKDE